MIRRANKNDLLAVNRLLFQVLEVHYVLRPDLYRPNTKKYTDKELLNIFEDDDTPIFVFADERDNVIGYAFCQIKDSSGRPNLVPAKTLYIDDLCVDGSCRRGGVGSQLYEYVCGYAKSIGCKSVTLNVWEGNDGARAFYESMGMFVRSTTMEKIL